MKKILISAKDLKIGGIEKSLLVLIDYLVEHGYIVTLVLEKIDGELLKQLNSNIKVIEYKPCSINFLLGRKFVNFFKRINFSIKYSKKFDVSISYTTYSKVCSYVSRKASKKTILWCHADYLELFNNDIQKVKEFFYGIHFKDFSKIVFVSKSAKKSFLKVFPENNNTYFCNNLINEKYIKEKALEEIELKEDNVTTFLNVGRHDEYQKRITRIIKASKVLKEENFEFRVIFVGSGKDTKKYKELVKEYNLEKNIIFMGSKENPYPYFKISNCIILSSDYEGYPVVYLESYILNKPIISTKVSDYEDIKKERGIITQKSWKGIYNAMKEFLKNGYIIQKEFNNEEYKKQIEKKIYEILEKF